MKEIKEIVEYIDDEMHDVKKYIKLALRYKGEDDMLFNTYIKLAKSEMEHAMWLHESAVAEINKAKSQNKVAPEYMLEIWNKEHEEYIEKMAKYKYELELASK